MPENEEMFEALFDFPGLLSFDSFSGRYAVDYQNAQALSPGLGQKDAIWFIQRLEAVVKGLNTKK
jgi:hypothetical protein